VPGAEEPSLHLLAIDTSKTVLSKGYVGLLLSPEHVQSMAQKMKNNRNMAFEVIGER
jgi:hypothetical protein